MSHTVLRRSEVMRRVGLRPSAFDELRKQPDFPKPVMITSRTPAWLEAEIEEWFERLLATRDETPDDGRRADPKRSSVDVGYEGGKINANR